MVQSNARTTGLLLSSEVVRDQIEPPALPVWFDRLQRIVVAVGRAVDLVSYFLGYRQC